MKKKIFFLGSIFFVALLSFPEEGEKIIPFSGYDWIVKDYTRPIGPGPNYFSRRALGLEGDSLALRILPRRTRWLCSEVYSREFFSYGTFTLEYYLPRSLDYRAVFGFFLYNDKNPPYYNEIDFEAARWGVPESTPYSFSVQPYERPGNSRSFTAGEQGIFTCRIVWTAEEIQFALIDGGGRILETWKYGGVDIPRDGESRVHLNLWLFEGEDPEDTGGLEVYIHSFSYEKNN